MSHIRVNKLLRTANMSLRDLQELMNDDEITPTTKVGVVNPESAFAGMSVEDLFSLRSQLYNELDDRISALRGRLNTPVQYDDDLPF